MEPCRHRIVDQHPAGKALAHSQQLLDHLDRLHRPHHPGQRTDHPRFLAGRQQSGRRRLGIETAIGRIGPSVGPLEMRLEGRNLCVELGHRRRHQGSAGEEARVGYEIAGSEIVAAVGNDVIGRDQIHGILGGDAVRVLDHAHPGVDPRQARRRARRLRQADARRIVHDLPLQIRQRHLVVIDHAQRADPGGREIHEQRRPEPAGTDHQHPRLPQPRLSWPADLLEHDMTGVALEFLIALCHVRSSPTSRSRLSL